MLGIYSGDDPDTSGNTIMVILFFMLRQNIGKEKPQASDEEE